MQLQLPTCGIQHRTNPICVASPKVVNVTAATEAVVFDFTGSFSVHNSIEVVELPLCYHG
jgi:hypothetical protein